MLAGESGDWTAGKMGAILSEDSEDINGTVDHQGGAVVPSPYMYRRRMEDFRSLSK